MKNRVFLLLLVVLSSCSWYDSRFDDSDEELLLETLFKNKDERLLDYFAVNENNKRLFWSEEFNTNDAKWPWDFDIKYSDVEGYFQDGILTIDYFGKEDEEYNYDYFFPDALPVTIDESKNFEMEMRFYIENKYLDEIDLCAFSNSSKPNVFYYFCIYDRLIHRDNYDIWFYKYTYSSDSSGSSDSLETIASLGISDYYDMNGFNTITVRKINNKFAFFFNKKLYCIYESDEFSCNSTWIVCAPGINKYDYCRVYYIQ
jgi:hypothetical protein